MGHTTLSSHSQASVHMADATGTLTASYPQEWAVLLPQVEEITDVKVSLSFQHGFLPVMTENWC